MFFIIKNKKQTFRSPYGQHIRDVFWVTQMGRISTGTQLKLIGLNILRTQFSNTLKILGTQFAYFIKRYYKYNFT